MNPLKWSSRERKIKKRKRIKLQGKVHKEKGKGKDKESKKRMAKLIREQRKAQEEWMEEDYWTEYNRS